MTPQQLFVGSCRMLVHLLRHHDGPLSGMQRMSNDEKLGATASSACEVLLHSLAIITGADYEESLRGLQSLEMEKRLKEICEEMNATLEINLDPKN